MEYESPVSSGTPASYVASLEEIEPKAPCILGMSQQEMEYQGLFLVHHRQVGSSVTFVKLSTQVGNSFTLLSLFMVVL